MVSQDREITENKISDEGATSLSEALKVNSSLTKLGLRCNYSKRKNTHIQKRLLIFGCLVKISRQFSWRRVDIVEWSIQDKQNTNWAWFELLESKRHKMVKWDQFNCGIFIILSTGNTIEFSEISALQEALTVNTTLKKIDLFSTHRETWLILWPYDWFVPCVNFNRC